MRLTRNRLQRTSRTARRHVGGGWLSLFAMWMIFIGPLVSQSMPMNHHAGMSMDMAMPMGMSMAAGSTQDAHAGHHTAGKATDNDGQLHVLWEKCGYCSLLFNCPALPQSLSPLALGHTPPAHLLPAPPRQGHAGQAVFPGARSRAPPQSLIV